MKTLIANEKAQLRLAQRFLGKASILITTLNVTRMDTESSLHELERNVDECWAEIERLLSADR